MKPKLLVLVKNYCAHEYQLCAFWLVWFINYLITYYWGHSEPILIPKSESTDNLAPKTTCYIFLMHIFPTIYSLKEQKSNFANAHWFALFILIHSSLRRLCFSSIDIFIILFQRVAQKRKQHASRNHFNFSESLKWIKYKMKIQFRICEDIPWKIRS